MARFFQILQEQAQVPIIYQRSSGHADNDVLALLAGHVLALAVASAPGPPVMSAGHVRKSVEAIDGFEVDASAVAAVAAVGTAARYEAFPPEADATVPAVAALNEDFDFIDKHCPQLACYSCPASSAG